MTRSGYREYLSVRKKEVGGWLQRVDAEIFGAILDYQAENDVRGGCAEIGVHHGKSFVPLCLALKDDEHAVCIDLFDDQDKNLDRSGQGHLSTFLANLSRFGIPESARTIIRASSEEVKPSQIKACAGQIRFFSIDGGHWASIVRHDLELAEQTLAGGGVIALDDYCRVEWPDVTAGYHFWQKETLSKIIPFAVGSNKLYLCNETFAETYRNALKTPFLELLWTKTYSSYVGDVDCYRVEHVDQDEANFLRRADENIRVFHPRLVRLLRIKQLLRTHPLRPFVSRGIRRLSQLKRSLFSLIRGH